MALGSCCFFPSFFFMSLLLSFRCHFAVFVFLLLNFYSSSRKRDSKFSQSFLYQVKKHDKKKGARNERKTNVRLGKYNFLSNKLGCLFDRVMINDLDKFLRRRTESFFFLSPFCTRTCFVFEEESLKDDSFADRGLFFLFFVFIFCHWLLLPRSHFFRLLLLPFRSWREAFPECDRNTPSQRKEVAFSFVYYPARRTRKNTEDGVKEEGRRRLLEPFFPKVLTFFFFLSFHDGQKA